MNAYDFDGTIYRGDSGVNFIKFVFLKKPFFILWHLMKSVKYVFLYKIKRISFKQMKEFLFSFVSKMDDLNTYTEEFAKKNKDRIKEYYQKCRKDNDIIISASLDFYLLPLCKEMGLGKVICTKYDVKSGKIVGENCKLEEKLKRFHEEYGEKAEIEVAYGDSKSDVPMLNSAKKGFVVKGETLVEYNRDFKF